MLDAPVRPTANISHWKGLTSSSAALAIAQTAQAVNYPLLVICADTAEANRLYSEIAFYIDKSLPLYHFTDWETLPYDHFSPHEDIVSARLETLYHLNSLTKGIVITTVTTAMHKLPPKQFLTQYSLVIKPGDVLDPHKFRQQLEQAGYHSVDTVYEHGEFAIRGALMDIYPMGSNQPFRIDFFDTDVDALRTFDPETQITTGQVDQIKLLPAKEYPLDKRGISEFRTRWHERFDIDHKACPIYQDISQGYASPGIEYYLPLFFEACPSLFDYLPEDSQLVLMPNLEARGQQFWQEAHQRFDNRLGDRLRPVLKPTELFIPIELLFKQTKAFNVVKLSTSSDSTQGISALPALAIDHKKDKPFILLENFIRNNQDQHILLCVESAGRREVLLDLLKPLNIKPAQYSNWPHFLRAIDQSATAMTGIIESPLDRGFIHPDFILITESELFGQQIQQKRRRKTSTDNQDNVIKNLTELKVGAPVVHIDHGVGRYVGLETITIDNQANEFVTLAYADDTKLYVPVTHLYLISRYSGGDEAQAPLHKLGSDAWQKAKDRAAKELRDVAAELLEIYAKRQARRGFGFDIDSLEYEKFCASFPFEATPDQHAAIEAVKQDMISKRPMDRLVCGDVGFGKTEVAMRAAFIAANAGKQVAVLVPTTLLAEQHYNNFKDRFADWPFKVEVLSRFRQAKDTTQIIEQVGSGQVDIVIGTHKLLQESIQFKDLGLLIIDEEHRFGVKQKDKVKALRSEVDILTLTATPIPRTLNMSMNGIRDLSIIATPPARRLSVKTFVRQRDDNLIKEAVMREMLRGGQVYFLHNDVKTIEKKARDLAELLPDARISIAHGQLRERELEQVMSDFYHHRANLLVCSTIIETGIDIPNANTIIIERADKFGLAQLHQLRGRVGRSHHQAYAYLLTPTPKTMTKDAQKRLEAIANTQDLGAGFTLATHDLEIRGAGELLGDEQSGQMHTIGFSLYMDMLNQTVKSLQSGKTLNSNDSLLISPVDVNLRIPALIPDAYLPDVHTRLIIYKRLSSIEDVSGLEALQVEMIDRFGLLPPEVKYLFATAHIKLLANALGMNKVEASAKQISIEFSEKPSVDPLAIINLVQSKPGTYRLKGANQLKVDMELKSAQERIDQVMLLFKALGSTEK